MEKDMVMVCGNQDKIIMIRMKANTSKIIKMDMVFIDGLMELFIKDHFVMI